MGSLTIWINYYVQYLNKLKITFLDNQLKSASNIKSVLLEKQKKRKIVPIDECNCKSNVHLKLVTGQMNLPCMNPIKEDSIITICYSILNNFKFITGCQVIPLQSPLEGSLSFTGSDKILENIFKNIDILETLIRRNQTFLNTTISHLIKIC